MMVVPVLITSCQVSLNLKIGPLIAHTTMIKSIAANVIGCPTIRSIFFANRPNQCCARAIVNLAKAGLRPDGTGPSSIRYRILVLRASLESENEGNLNWKPYWDDRYNLLRSLRLRKY